MHRVELFFTGGFLMIRYEGDIYRPPSEANSLLIQATIGCSWNRCSFCALYGAKNFRIRSLDEIFSDLEWARRHYRRIEKIFLCDGDALCLSTSILTEIFRRIKNLFPECRSISVYGNARDVLSKGPEDLKQLANEGLGMVYIGAESGSDEVLASVNKGSTAEDMITSIRLLEDSGIKASVTFISGLGGTALAREHAVSCGQVVTESAPSYFSLLTLVLLPQMPLYSKLKSGEFTPLSTSGIIEETSIFFENINLPERIESLTEPGVYRIPSCVFRSNHVSNAFPLRGTFPEDREALIKTLKMY